jgi:hypothetical protein
MNPTQQQEDSNFNFNFKSCKLTNPYNIIIIYVCEINIVTRCLNKVNVSGNCILGWFPVFCFRRTHAAAACNEQRHNATFEGFVHLA